MPTLRLPAGIESFESFRAFVLAEIESMHGTEGLSLQVDLVLEEILINAISYAYPEGGGDIEVECLAEDVGRFRLTVRDWGGAFNPLEQAAPDLTADISNRKVGGLGIYLVKQMTSRITYHRRDGCNVLTMWFEKSG